jgi:hypothetical protein
MRRRRLRPLSKQAQRNRVCHEAIKEIKGGNCSLLDMSWAVNEACRRAPKKLQMQVTKTINRSCGGRLHGASRGFLHSAQLRWKRQARRRAAR